MKALILSGEVTHQRPMSYGFGGDWETETVPLIDSEHITVCEKYGDSRSVSQAEVMTLVRRAYERVVSVLLNSDPDAVVGVGYGAHVLLNLNSSHEWRGPSTFILSEGNPAKFCFAQGPLPDEIDYDPESVAAAWFIVDEEMPRSSRAARSGTSLRRLSDMRRRDIIVSVPNGAVLSELYTAGVIAGVTRSLLM